MFDRRDDVNSQDSKERHAVRSQQRRAPADCGHWLKIPSQYTNRRAGVPALLFCSLDIQFADRGPARGCGLFGSRLCAARRSFAN